MHLVVTAVVVGIHWRRYPVHVVATPSANAAGHVTILHQRNTRWSCVSAQ